MQDTLGVDLLWEGQSYKPGYHGNKGRTLTWLNDEVVLRTWVSVTSMSMNITSFKCGDIVCASSWMLWIRCIQRSQVLLVICSAACVNHLLFAEQSHRWRLKWQDFDWLAGWLCVCVRVWQECEKNFSLWLCFMLRFLAAALIWLLWLCIKHDLGWPGLGEYESEHGILSCIWSVAECRKLLWSLYSLKTG